jgi:hypothetical protein
MAAWKDFKPHQRAAAEKAFEAFDLVDGLSGRSPEVERGEERRVGFSDLYAFAHDGARAMDDALRRALGASPVLRDSLDRLLDEAALYHFPRVAAASSGSVEARDGEGFRLRLKRSRAAADQTYVIIEVDDSAGGVPRTLVTRDAEGRYLKVELPEAQGGVIQLLADTESDLVRALGRVETEVFVR